MRTHLPEQLAWTPSTHHSQRHMGLNLVNHPSIVTLLAALAWLQIIAMLQKRFEDVLYVLQLFSTGQAECTSNEQGSLETLHLGEEPIGGRGIFQWLFSSSKKTQTADLN